MQERRWRRWNCTDAFVAGNVLSRGLDASRVREGLPALPSEPLLFKRARRDASCKAVGFRWRCRAGSFSVICLSLSVRSLFSSWAEAHLQRPNAQIASRPSSILFYRFAGSRCLARAWEELLRMETLQVAPFEPRAEPQLAPWEEMAARPQMLFCRRSGSFCATLTRRGYSEYYLPVSVRGCLLFAVLVAQDRTGTVSQRQFEWLLRPLANPLQRETEEHTPPTTSFQP